MTSEVQPPDVAADLLAVAERVVRPWLRRIVTTTARRAGADPDGWDDLDRLVDDTAAGLLDDLATLLALDVDEQRTNPLSIFRGAVVAPTEYLVERGVRPAGVDRFGAERFPEDVFGLGPATWSDVDDDLHVPGLTWGAWKAKTVLDRRRAEGLR